MAQTKQLFHLAIPTHDIAKAKKFYHAGLGAHIGREYPNYVIFNFFGHQLVCHEDQVDLTSPVSMYPRHFGIIFTERELFEDTYLLAKKSQLPFFEEKFERFKDGPGRHWSFFLIDPSNNLIEFKYYHDQASVL